MMNLCTKWCGAGNIADGYEDLGTEIEADMCCRDHDNCPEVIPGGETRHNLTNTVFYSRLSCHCDNTFHRCLKSADTRAANIIGNIYFNALQTKCYRKDYPILKYGLTRNAWHIRTTQKPNNNTNGLT
ncbi:unnamed protein product [Arctia plantaginis]|uniref:phospholipase A2 n=1 Tax=Arctia plantaginis TaxID=874455 RepID=A0A8S1AGK0_ARCPL|nr:unnamed protein product [Arctia plantaginis]